VKTEIMDKAIGFHQDIPGGAVFELANGYIGRRIHVIGGRVSTTSLINRTNDEEYLDSTPCEFKIVLTGGGQRVELDSSDFTYQGFEMPDWTDEIRTIVVKLSANFHGTRIDVRVCYQVQACEDFMRKWIEVLPCAESEWVIRTVTIEHLKLKEMIEGVVPAARYPEKHANQEDRVHSRPDEVNVDQPEKRFDFGDLARAVVTYWGYGEGLYFFAESLLGEESFHRPTGLVIKQRDFAPLSEGITTGPAVIGAYSGPPEIGFKRYTKHLMDHWCCVKGKDMPVSWSTWLVTFPGNKPLYGDYNRALLLEYIDYIKEAGFFDILHLDLGWEANYPMQVDAEKFPNGMKEITRKAKEVANLDMTYWLNPFSSSYWKSKIEEDHPEWLVPGKISGRSGGNAICIATDYSEYVKNKFVELATQMNARVIYWDGNDWNIPECTATNHDHSDQEELRVKAWKRLAEACTAAHEARPDLMFVVFSLPFDNHRLNVLDQEQISDTYSYPTVQSELIQRQQLYQMTWEHPYMSIWGSWYGVNWHDAGESDLSLRPLEELIHAEMSMIGNGICQAGGGFDLKSAPSEFMDFLKKLFAFRKRFAKYFNTYQHVLDFPDGKKIDGEGHIVDGKGFIVLVNPTRSTLSVKVPLADVELELDAGARHELSDWSGLTEGKPMGAFSVDKAPEISLAPLEVKYVGVNIV
jgi:hypothetical protein